MSKKPNVIFMFVDDLGIGDISSFNPDGKINTPNIDALAADGMRFTDSHACSALCTPSRYSLLTGRYPWRSRLKCLVLPGDSNPLIEKGRMTMADLFHQAGYRTACVGKWHLGLEWQRKAQISQTDFRDAVPEDYDAQPDHEPVAGHWSHIAGIDIDYSKPIQYGPNQYGFDYFFGLPASLDQPPFVYIENDRVLEEPTAISGVKRLDRRTATMQTQWERGPIAPGYNHTKVLDDMNDKVLELIDVYSESGNPFFIYYPTPAVHDPLFPNEKFKGKSGLNLYADVVLQVDDMVGQITAKLRQKGIYQDTIFVFTSDNGCSGVADYPLLQSLGHDPSAGYRGKKFSIYEGGHRVPTIVTYPAKITGGTVSAGLVSHADFFRSFAELLGVNVPDSAAEDSVSNLPLWRLETESVREDTVFASGAGFLAIEKDGWKLELCENGGDSDQAMQAAVTHTPLAQQFELYHLPTDQVETSNIIEQHPELVRELKRQLSKYLEEGRSTVGIKQENFVPDYPWIQINWK